VREEEPSGNYSWILFLQKILDQSIINIKQGTRWIQTKNMDAAGHNILYVLFEEKRKTKREEERRANRNNSKNRTKKIMSLFSCINNSILDTIAKY